MSKTAKLKIQNKIVVGIIGAGMIAERHIVSLQKIKGVSIKWVARKDKSQLVNFQMRYSIPMGTINYHEILLDSEVNAIIITTPPQMHYQIFIDCVNAGKHVLLEKPAAIKQEHIEEMLVVANAHPELKIMDCSARHSRLQPKFKKVKELINSGKLGNIYFVHHNAVVRQSRPGIEYHPTAKWFLNKALAGGGPLFDWGVYDLSFHLGLFNDTLEVEMANLLFMKNGLDKCNPGTEAFDVEEHFAAQLSLSNGIKYYWERSSNANMEAKNETRIYGTKGGIKLAYCSWDEPVIELFDVEEKGRGTARKESILVDYCGHDDNDALSAHFVNVIFGNEENTMPLFRAAKHLKVIFNLYDQMQ